MWGRQVVTHNSVSKRLGKRKQGLQQCASKIAGGNLRNSASLKPRTVNFSYCSSVSVLRSRSFEMSRNVSQRVRFSVLWTCSMFSSSAGPKRCKVILIWIIQWPAHFLFG